MPTLNKQCLLVKRPIGVPDEDTWQFVAKSIPEIQGTEVLVKIDYVSLDPAMRGWMNEGKSYIEPIGLGGVMRSFSAGQVIESRDERFAVGDYVVGLLGVQQYAVCHGDMLQKVDVRKAPLQSFIGGLGITGLTAYFGLLDVGGLKQGGTVLVSGAAGAVGSVVGQIAKIKGARVVGIAGGEEKCNFVVKELGFDACLDYKANNFKSELKSALPDGIDVFFDNVGGEILDIALTRLNLKARVVLCGAISQYNNTTPVEGPHNYVALIIQRARMEGFILFDYADRYAEALDALATWYAEGKIKFKEQVEEGIENFPSVFLKLFTGENLGKLILKVSNSQ